MRLGTHGAANAAAGGCRDEQTVDVSADDADVDGGNLRWHTIVRSSLQEIFARRDIGHAKRAIRSHRRGRNKVELFRCHIVSRAVERLREVDSLADQWSTRRIEDPS